MVENLKEMQQMIAASEKDNPGFKKFLRLMPMAQVQALAVEISLDVEAKIDCTQCGNCCRKLEPALQAHEILRLGTLSEIPVEKFIKKQVLTEGELCFLKAKPCYFLKGDICKIYESRPESCRDFPHLRSGNFKYKRSIWINYSLCPIVFNTIEIMKTRTGFK